MSKSVSEVLKENDVILTDAPDFENPVQETSEKTRVELAVEMTNANISKKCRKAFNKFVKKYKLEIDFEKYEGKSDELKLMGLINKTASDDEDASLVRHMKSYCKVVLKNLSKLPKEEAITGINGEVISEKEVKEFVDTIGKEANFSRSEREIFDSLKDSLTSGLLDTMREVDTEVEKLVGDARKEWLVSRLTANMKKYSDYSEDEIRKFAEGVVSVMDEMDEEESESKATSETSETAGNASKKQAEAEKVEKEDNKVETKKEPETAAPKKTLTMPMMSDYIKAGKVNQYARDLEAYFLQRA